MIESAKRGTTEFIHKFLRELTMGLFLDFEKIQMNLFKRNIAEFGILAKKFYVNLRIKMACSIKLQHFAGMISCKKKSWYKEKVVAS